jgi:hypothetical protein
MASAVNVSSYQWLVYHNLKSMYYYFKRAQAFLFVGLHNLSSECNAHFSATTTTALVLPVVLIWSIIHLLYRKVVGVSSIFCLNFRYLRYVWIWYSWYSLPCPFFLGVFEANEIAVIISTSPYGIFVECRLLHWLYTSVCYKIINSRKSVSRYTEHCYW